MFKRSIFFATLLCVMFAFSGLASANSHIFNDNVFNDKDGNYNFNLELRNEIQNNDNYVLIGKNVLSNGSLKLRIKKNTDENYITSGDLVLNDNKYLVEASGDIKYFDVEQSKDYLFGQFNGYLYDGNHNKVEVIVFDIQYSKKNHEASSSMTIGLVTSDSKNKPLSISFGKISKSENNSFFEKYILTKENNKHDKNKHDFLIQEEVPDYTLRTHDTFDSGFGDIMYIAGYHPDTLGAHESGQMFLKMWTNKTNILSYYEDYFNENFVTGSVGINEVQFWIENEPNWEADDEDPEDGENNISVLLPIYAGSSLGFQLITIGIPVSSTDYQEIANGSSTHNKAQWTLNDYTGSIQDTDAQSSTPWYDNDSYGIGGKAAFSYAANISQDTNKDIIFAGTFYTWAVSYNGVYENKYLSFYENTNSQITVTP